MLLAPYKAIAKKATQHHHERKAISVTTFNPPFPVDRQQALGLAVAWATDNLNGVNELLSNIVATGRSTHVMFSMLDEITLAVDGAHPELLEPRPHQPAEPDGPLPTAADWRRCDEAVRAWHARDLPAVYAANHAAATTGRTTQFVYALIATTAYALDLSDPERINATRQDMLRYAEAQTDHDTDPGTEN